MKANKKQKENIKEILKIVEMQVLHHELKINILKPMIPNHRGIQTFNSNNFIIKDAVLLIYLLYKDIGNETYEKVE
jgi:hypothetical protein